MQRQIQTDIDHRQTDRPADRERDREADIGTTGGYLAECWWNKNKALSDSHEPQEGGNEPPPATTTERVRMTQTRKHARGRRRGGGGRGPTNLLLQQPRNTQGLSAKHAALTYRTHALLSKTRTPLAQAPTRTPLTQAPTRTQARTQTRVHARP
jgi:hypothetical protein